MLHPYINIGVTLSCEMRLVSLHVVFPRLKVRIAFPPASPSHKKDSRSLLLQHVFFFVVVSIMFNLNLVPLWQLTILHAGSNDSYGLTSIGPCVRSLIGIKRILMMIFLPPLLPRHISEFRKVSV